VLSNAAPDSATAPPAPTDPTAVAAIAPLAKRPRPPKSVSSKRPWDRQVFDWLHRRARKHDIVAAYPVPLSRFIHDLDIFVDLADGGSVRHASAIVAFFYRAYKDERGLDPRVAAYIQAAERRYRAARKKDMESALGLVRRQDGRPRGEPVAGTLTDDARVELVEYVQEKIAAGIAEKVAVIDASEIFRVDQRSVRRAVQQARDSDATAFKVEKIRG
jgi:hypothetical protein